MKNIYIFLTFLFAVNLSIGQSCTPVIQTGVLSSCNGGTIPLTVGYNGPAIQFDGVDDYISIPEHIDKNFTIEFWMKTTQTGPGSGVWSDGYGIIDADQPGNGVAMDGGISLVGNKLAFGVGGNGDWSDTTVFSTSNVNTGQWIHVAVTKFNYEAKIYINGVLEATGLASDYNFDTVNVFIGRIATGGKFFAGSLDNIRIWNSVRTVAQIQSGMNYDFPAATTNLLDNLPMNDNTGTTTANLATGVAATLSNGPLWGNRSSLGKYNSYNWSPGGATTSSINAASGTYTVTTTDANGCVATSTSKVVTAPAYPAPVIQGSSGTCANTPITLSVGYNGPALQFNGSNNYFDFARQVSDDFTIEYWMKTTQTAGAGTDWHAGSGIVDGEVPGNVADFGTSLKGSKLAFGIGGGGSLTDYTIISDIDVNTGVWMHVAVTRVKASGELKIFINGVQRAVGYAPFKGSLTAPTNIRVGSLQRGDSYFNGSVDDIRMWNVALDANQIKSGMNTSFPPGTTNLVSNLPLNENTGNSVANLATGIPSTLINSPTWANRTTTDTYNSYLWSTGATSSTITVNSAVSVTVTATNAVGCSRTSVAKVITMTTATPTAASPQVFNSGTVANLAATGTGLQWYNVSTGGSALASSAVLTTGIYYVSQTVASCESARLAVQVNINGAALDFDGTDDAVILPSGPVINGSFTVEAWVKPADGTKNMHIVSTRESGDNSFDIQILNGNTIHGDIGNGSTWLTTAANATFNYTVGTWFHVAYVVTPTGYTIYANGNAVGSGTYSGTPMFIAGTRIFSIGRSAADPTFFKGQMDEVRVWSRALTQCEIQNNMSTELSAAQTNLALYYKFNQGIAGGTNTGLTSVADSSGTNNIATFVNAALTGTQSNWVSLGGVAIGSLSPTFTALAVTSPQNFCTAATVADLTATGSNIKWYLNSSGGSALASNTVLTTGNYYVTQTTGTCESARTAVAVTVNNATAPTASAQAFCFSATVNDLVASGTNLKWYAGASGGPVLPTNTSLTTANYYVSQTIGSCESGRTTVAVTVTNPSAPTASAQTFCFSGTVSNLAVTSGVNLKWYQGSSGGPVLSGATALSTNTYYVSQTVAGCESARTAVSVTINNPLAPTASATQSFCGSGLVSNLTATGTTLKWYLQSSGGSALAGSTALTTAPYYVSQTIGSCEGPRTTVNVQVNPLPVISISPSTVSLCAGGSVSLTASGGVSYVWTSAPTLSGSLTSGTVTATPTVTTTYTVTATLATGCTASRSITVVVNPLNAVSITAGSATTLCAGQSVALTAVNNNNSPALQFSPAGLNSAKIKRNISDDFTIEFWIKTTATGSSSWQNRMAIVDTYLPTEANDFGIGLMNGWIAFSVGNTADFNEDTTVAISGTNVNSGAWTHVAVTRTKSTGEVEIYINGVISAFGTGSVVNTNSLSGSAEISIGRRQGGAASTILDGSLDDIRFWNVARTPSEIASNMNKLLPAGTPNLVDNLQFNEGAGSVGTNRANPDNDAVLTNPSWTTHTYPAGSVLWSNGATTPQITVSTSGTYTATVTDVNGCSASSAGTVVTVNPIAAAKIIAPSATLCAGNSMQLSAKVTSSSSPALTLNGTSTFVTIPRPVSTNFTIEFWMKTTQTGLTGLNWYNGTGLIDAEVGGTTNDFGIALMGGKVAFGIGLANSGNDKTLFSNTSVNTGEWIHVAVTRSTAGTFSIFINGVLDNQTTSTNNNALTSSGNMVIGTIQGSAAFYNGSMDDIRFWTTVRTGAEILANMNTSSPTGTNLAVNFPLNENTGTSISNTASNSYNATGATWTIHPLYINPVSVLWSNGSTANPLTITDAGSYTVTTVDANGCSSTSPATTITSVPLPDVTVSSNTSICLGSNTTLIANGASTYTWSPSTGLSATTGNSVVAAPTTTTTYTVTGTGANGCTVDKTVTVTVLTLPTVSASAGSTTICSGSSTTLTANGAVTYVWSPSTGLSATTGASVTASPTITTTYTVTGTAANGCTSQATVTVTTDGIATIEPAAAYICPTGTPVRLAFAEAASDVVLLSEGFENNAPGWTTAFSGFTNWQYDTNNYNISPSPKAAFVRLFGHATDAQLTSPAFSTVGAQNVILQFASYTQSYYNVTTAKVEVSIDGGANWSLLKNYSHDGTFGTYTLGLNDYLGQANVKIRFNYHTDFGYEWAIDDVKITKNTAQAVWSPLASLFTDAAGTMPYTGALSTFVYANPSATTTYTATGTGPLGCAVAKTVKVDLLNVTVDRVLCGTGGLAILTATGASSYTWSPTDGLYYSTGSTNYANPSVTTTYTVTGTTANGCTSTKNITVYRVPYTTPSMLSSSTTYCTASGAIPLVVKDPQSETILISEAFNSMPTGWTITNASETNPTRNWNIYNGQLAARPIISSVNTIFTSPAIATTGYSEMRLSFYSIYSDYAATVGNIEASTDGGTTWSVLYRLTNNDAYKTVFVPITSAYMNQSNVMVRFNYYGAQGYQWYIDDLVITGVNSHNTWAPQTDLYLDAAMTMPYTGTATNGVFAHPTSATTYTATTTNVNGCATATNNVTITANLSPVLSVTPSQTVCQTIPVTLTATGADTYTWSPSTGLSATTGASVIATPAVTTTYTVTGQSAAGCAVSKTVTLTVTPYNAPTVASTSVTSCSSDPAVALTVNDPASTVTLLSENFNSGASGWTITNGSTSYPDANWNFSYSGYFDGTLSASARPLGNGGLADTILTSPLFSTVGYTNAKLSFLHVYYPYTGQSAARVEISTDGGTTWNLIVQYDNSASAAQSTPLSFNLDAYAGQANCRLRFKYNSTNSGYMWHIDNVLITTLFPRTTWTPQTNLYTDAAATIPYSGDARNTVYAKPASTTAYSAYSTHPSGCAKTNTITVTALQSSNVTVSPNVAICVGSATTLTASGDSISYAWSPATGLNTTTGTTVIASPTATTTYTVSGTSSNGCITRKTVVVTVNPHVVPTLNNTTFTKCAAAPAVAITVNDTDANVVLLKENFENGFPGWVISNWGPAGSIIGEQSAAYSTLSMNGVITSPVFTTMGVSSAVLTFRQIYGHNSSSQARVDISTDGGTNWTMVNTMNALFGAYNLGTATLDLSAYVNQPNLKIRFVYTYGTGGYWVIDDVKVQFTNPQTTWSPTTGLYTDAAATTVYTGGIANTVYAKPNSTTVYSANTNPFYGCSSSVTATVNVTAAPAVNFTGTTNICLGNSTTLTATGSDTYVWSPATGLNATTGATVIANPIVTTTYTVTGTIGGCTATNTIMVTVTQPTLAISPASAYICIGGSVSLTASGATSYSWSPSTGLDTTSGATVVATPSATTTYTVSGLDVSGCTFTKNVTITVNPVPMTAPIVVSSGPTTFCEAGSTVLSISNSISNTIPAMHLDGNGYTNFNQSYLDDFTIEYWMRTTSTGSDGGDWHAGKGIVDGEVGGNVNDLGTSLTGSKLAFGVGGGGIYPDKTIKSTSNVNTGQWIHIAATRKKSTGKLTLYINGVEEATTIAQNTFTMNGMSQLAIGRLYRGDSYFIGDLQNIRVWNVVRTPGEITASMNISYPVSTANLLNNFILDENTGTTITNTANATTNIINGITWTTRDVNYYNSYLWSNGAATPSITVNNSGSYSVQTTGSSGCSAGSNIVPVTVLPASVNVSASGNTICNASESVMLTASGAAESYSWSPSAGLSATTGSVVTANPAVTTTYTVTGSFANGCTAVNTVTITVYNPVPVIRSSPATTLICEGTSVHLSTTAATDNQAAYMNGSYTYFERDFTQPTTNDFTFEYWMKTTQTGQEGTAWNNGTWLLSYSGGGIPSSGTSLLGNKLAFGIGDGSANTIVSTTSVNDGAWHHIAATRSKTTGVIKLYIDGNQEAVATIPNTSSLFTRFLTGGRYVNNSYIGMLDEVREWNIVRSAAEISTAGNTTYPTGAPGLVFNLELNGNLNRTGAGGSFATYGYNVSWGNRSEKLYDSYLWSNGAITPSINVTEAGNYSVQITDEHGCTATSAVTTMSMTPLPVVTAVAVSPTICENSSTVITANGGVSYRWSPSTGLDTTTGDTVTASPTVTTTYTVTGTNINGCTASYDVTVTVNPAPPVVVTPETVAICNGNSTVLTVGGADTYSWSPATGLSSTTGSSVTANPSATTTYTVTGTNALGCTKTDTVTVTVNPVGIPDITANGSTALCSGSSVTLSADSAYDSPAFAFESNNYNYAYNYNYVYNPATGNNETLSLTDNLTAECWVKTTQTSPTGTQWYEGAGIVFGTQWSSKEFGISLLNDKAVFGVAGGDNGTDTTISSVTTINDGEWHHVAASRNKATGELKLYVDGINEATGTSNNPDELNPFVIMVGENDWNDIRLTGSVDDVKLWDIVRTPSEIASNSTTLYTQGTSGLRKYFKFNAFDSYWYSSPEEINPAEPVYLNNQPDIVSRPTSYPVVWSTGATTSSITVNTAGSYTAQMMNDYGCIGMSAPTVVTNGVTGGTNGTVAPDQSVCINSIPADLTVTGYNGNILRWERSTDAAFTSPIIIASTSATLLGTTIGAINTTNYFRIVTDSSCAANSAYATITTGGTTTWNGTIWSNGVPTSLMSATISGLYNSTGDLNACSLTVTNNAQVTVNTGHDFNIYGKVTVDAGSLLTFENNANLLQTLDVANAGNIKYKRLASMVRQDYVYWSAPVTGQNLHNFSQGTLANRFYTLDEAANNFAAIDPMTNDFIPAKGFMIRAPNNFVNPPALPQPFTGIFTGVPNNGTITMPITHANQGYNMIGNPYPSSIDGQLFLAQNPGTLYFWTHRSQEAASGANYCSYNTTGGTAAISGGNPPTGTIVSGQGFVLLAPANGTATFSNSMRTGNNAGVFYRDGNEKHRIWLNLNSPTSGLNQMLVGYIDGATIGEDIGMDGKLIEGGSSISSLVNGQPYVIQGRSLPFEDSDVVPMNFKAQTAGTYTIALDHVDGLFEQDQNIYIKDNLLGIIHDIKQSEYTFASAEGSFANRFEIVYQNSPLGTENPVIAENEIVLYKEQGIIRINSGTVIMAQVKVFDIRGRLIYEKKDINASTTSLDDLKAEEEVLLVQITSNDGRMITKKAIN